MFKNIKSFFERHRTIRSVKQLQYHHTNLPELLGTHKELRQYVPKLKELCEYKNRLIFENRYITVTKEIQFAKLILGRNQDFFEAILFSLWHNTVHAVFPLMRALVEDLFLLKYVDKHPEYINKFLDTEVIDRDKRLSFLKGQCHDDELKKYCGFLCNMAHPNPVALKDHLLRPYTFDGKPIETEKRFIVVRSTCDEFYVQSVKALMRIYSEEIAIIDKIFVRNFITNIEETTKNNKISLNGNITK
jgi:hypothetical protein